MSRIIKLHGCSGAGKTTAVRSLINNAESYTIATDARGKPGVYMLRLPEVAEPVFVLGSYDASCGGVDTISDVKDVIKMVHDYAPKGHVVFEGLLQSTYYGKMGVDSQQYGNDYIYAFMDTPVGECVQRVVERRERNGTKTKFNPNNTVDKHATIQHLLNKLMAGVNGPIGFDHTVMRVIWDRPIYPQLVSLLNLEGP